MNGKVVSAVAALALLATYPVAHADTPDVLAGVTVAPFAHRSDYRRAAFGEGWPKDSAGCDVRDDVLDRDLTNKTYMSTSRCRDAVATGTLVDPYTGTVIVFQHGERTSAAVQIDHLVPLAYAWDMGAWAWPADKRAQFYTDPTELLAVDGEANQAKGDSPPGRWMPPNTAYSCTYDREFVAVLREYSLPIDPASANVLRAESCQ
jgi:Protein of unknown function (DUF1524)